MLLDAAVVGRELRVDLIEGFLGAYLFIVKRFNVLCSFIYKSFLFLPTYFFRNVGINGFDVKFLLKNSVYQRIVLNIFFFEVLFQYKVLLDIGVLDVPTQNKRFSVSYIVMSFFTNIRIFATYVVNEISACYSLENLYENVCWMERECYDMFGIFFLDHTNLRRILTDYGFIHYPLRKDFPVVGFYDLWFNSSEMVLCYEKVLLTQFFRDSFLRESYSIN